MQPDISGLDRLSRPDFSAAGGFHQAKYTATRVASANDKAVTELIHTPPGELNDNAPLRTSVV